MFFGKSLNPPFRGDGQKNPSTKFKKEGVKQIDYFVFTHSDSDHIAGATHVIDTLPIKSIVMPLKISFTETYFDVLLAIKEKKISLIHADKRDFYSQGMLERKQRLIC
ncbi:MBL fold metallo-hydrolase [Aneurinibacillus aneurinilyticus]|uniref:MBL fold metallo-hydrolase n=1 Tax=Aneurinibacillus aneurinilyticus TaxID=1391 RepID=UPI0035251F4F